MTKLSVNINKIATIRNARGGNNPNLVQVAKDCEAFGAQGITIHPRPDERHITKKDVYSANALVEEDKIILGFNVELTEESKGIKGPSAFPPQPTSLI